MTVFFTSDLHLGHANIAAYCRRPWLRAGDYDFERRRWTSTEAREACADRMNNALIRNWNSRVKPDDTAFHIGDFCCRGRDRGVPGTLTRAESWEERMNGRIIHIKGNHDPNNSVKLALDCAVIGFSGKKWFMTHRPPYKREDIPDSCDVVLCGHVHEKWSHIMVEDIPVINVGVDVRRFMPLTKAEVETLRFHVVRQYREKHQCK